MASSKLTALTAAAALAGADLTYVSQGGVSLKATMTQIKTWCSASPTFVTPIIGAATGSTLTLSSYMEIGAVGAYYISSRMKLGGASDGVISITNYGATDFGRLQFGGTTSSFPALKRSTTILQGRLADDSAFASLQGKLTTDVAAVTGLTAGVLSALTDASIVVYDAGGQAYRIPCII